MSKGCWKRPKQITMEENQLRFELAFETKDNPKRKEEILNLLEIIEKEKKK